MPPSRAATRTPAPEVLARDEGPAVSPSERDQWIRALCLLGAATVIVGLVWVLYLARQALLLIYVSALLATGFHPLVAFIERQRVLRIGTNRVPRWLAILCVYVTILAGLGLLASAVLPMLIGQGQDLFAQLPTFLAQADGYLSHQALFGRHKLADAINQASKSSELVPTILLTAWNLLGGVFGIFTILLLTFYLLVESEQLFTGFVRLFPRDQREEIKTASAEIARKVSAWLSAQLVLSCVIFLTSVVGLGLIGLPYFYVLAVLAALGELIPFVGPLLAALPGIVIALTSSWELALGVGAFYLAQQQLESNVLLPKLMGKQVGLSAVGVIIALVIGEALLGVLGAMLAVPTAAILQVIYQKAVTNGE